MESVNMRALPSPSGEPQLAQAAKSFNKSCPLIRKGVESREVVRQQAQLIEEVVELLSDEEERRVSPPPWKRRRLSNDLWSSCEERPQKRTLTGTNNTSILLAEKSSEHLSTVNTKKRLFQSMCIMDRSSHNTSPPTPPKSPPEYPCLAKMLNSANATDSLQSPSRLAEELDSRNANTPDAEAAAELSMHMSQFFDPPKPQRSLANSGGKPNRFKNYVEALGVARSQALREKRKQETNNSKDDSWSFISILRDIDNNSTDKVVRNTAQGVCPVSGSGRQHPISHNLHKSQQVFEPAKFYIANDDPATLATDTSLPSDTCHGDISLSIHPLAKIKKNGLRPQKCQSEYLGVPKTPSQAQSTAISPVRDQQREEERLIRIAQTALASPWQPKPKVKTSRPVHRLPTTFRMPDLGDSRTDHLGGRQALRKLMGVESQAENAPAQDVFDQEGSESSRSEHDNTTTPSKSSIVNLAILQKFNNQHHTSSHDIYNDLQPQGLELSLPPTYKSRSPQVQEKIRVRETLKERAKDFEAISKAFEAFANLGALRPFKEIELKELGEIRKFCDAVFEKNLSGKRARQRILNIATNSRTRIRSIGEIASAERIDKVLRDVLKHEYAHILNVEGEEIKAKLRQIGEISSGGYKKRRDRLTELADADELNSPFMFMEKSSNKPKGKRISKTDQQMAAMQDALARFEYDHNAHDGHGDDSDAEVIDLGDSQHHEEGDSSEEDEGEELMRPAGFTTHGRNANDADSIQSESLEHAEQSCSEREMTIDQPPAAKIITTGIASQGTQIFDQYLLDKMQSKQRLQAHIAQQEVQPPVRDLVQRNKRRQYSNVAAQNTFQDQVTQTIGSDLLYSSLPDDEFDDSDLDANETESKLAEVDGDDRPQCWRYIVKLIECNGFYDGLDGHELEQGKYASYDRARRHLEELIIHMKHAYRSRHQAASDRGWSIQAQEDDEKYDFVMVSMNNNAHGCHLQVERELYNPSREAYEKAKIKAACKSHDMWYIDWERAVYAIDRDEGTRSEVEENTDCELLAGHADQVHHIENDHYTEADEQTIPKVNEEVRNAPPSEPICPDNAILGSISGDDSHERSKDDCHKYYSEQDPHSPPATIEEHTTDQPQTHNDKLNQSGGSAAPSTASFLSLAVVEENNTVDDLDEELFGLDPNPQDQTPTQLNTVADAGAIVSPTISPTLAHTNTTSTSPSQTETAPPSTSEPQSTKITIPATACELLEASASSTSAGASISTDMDSRAFNPTAPNAEPTSAPASTTSTSTSPLHEPVVERMTGDELRIFSSVACANRYASECFLDWYTRQKSVVEDEEQIEKTKKEIEEELEFHGMLQLWQREESFTSTSDERWEIVDRFKVWVRKADSRGPSN